MVKVEFTFEEKEAGKINLTRKVKEKTPTDNEKVATATVIELFNRSAENYTNKK